MQDHRADVLVVSIIFFVIATVFVALRFVSRIFVVRKVGLHDHLMSLAWVIDFGFSFSLFYATHKGLGLHDYDIEVHDRAGLNKANYAFTVLYVSFTWGLVVGARANLGHAIEPGIDGRQIVHPRLLSDPDQRRVGLPLGKLYHSVRRQCSRVGLDACQRLSMSSRRCRRFLSPAA